MGLKADMPYPSLEGIGEDCAALRVISPAYAGRRSELTAILQYVYQSVLFGEWGNKEASKTLIDVAVTEMHHLEILGSLIAKLGAPPVFTGCPPYPVGYFSASCVNYTKVPKQMICADICAEENAISEYERMLCALRNPRVFEVIQRIIEDERLHLQAFGKLLESL